MSYSKRRKLLSVAVLISITLLMIGCGRTDDPVSYVPSPLPGGGYPNLPYNPSCPAGTYMMYWGTCVPYQTYSFQDSCGYAGGQYIANHTPALCKVSRYVSINVSIGSGVPRLAPSVPTSVRALSTGIHVWPGDTVVASSNEGCWVGSTSPNILCNGDSTETDVNGIKNGSLQTNESLPQGLVISDGTTVSFVGGTVAQPVQITHSGNLLVGFNAPSSVTTGMYSLRTPNFSVTQCVDSTGTSYQCP